MTEYRPFPKPATPLPWRIVVETPDYRPDVAACHIWTAKGPGYGMVATTAPWCQPYEKERQDAAYILAACNAFPAVTDALENLIIGIGMGWDLDGLIDQGQRALALAVKNKEQER